MKQVLVFMTLILLAISMGVAQDDAVVKQTAAEQPKAAGIAATAVVPQGSPLDELAWMVGQWIDEGDNSKITTACSWTENGKFLKRSFTVTIDGKPKPEGHPARRLGPDREADPVLDF